MELKEYQAAALNAFVRWREALQRAQMETEAVLATQDLSPQLKQSVGNYPARAWEGLAAAGALPGTGSPHADRMDAAGRPIPHVCFKVPTGGGKTLLAAAALDRLNRSTGLTLWITPSRAIYEQTERAFRNRTHPYRQMLERASGGRVRLLEKDDALTRADITHYFCVMLLMLPATNRQKGKEFLRMFRDSGRYPTLFPADDDTHGHDRLLKAHPDLERLTADGPAKHSLFNVFKMLRPVVVLDEAHKAYGAQRQGADREFVRSINRLDPELVIELSATPNPGISNLLVDVSGTDLKRESMVKLPVQVTSFANTDWHHTLAQAHEELERLTALAGDLQAEEGRYIRPIAVVRVERTGKGQRDGQRIHAEDARDYLIRSLEVPERAIAVKSSDRDEIAGVDLLSELTPVQWIITKAALMEGWDCPFAYILVMLDNTAAQRAITQLVGRVMRQPEARRTGRAALDQCHVYCSNTRVRDAVAQVKRGLEAEGLTGLGNMVTAVSPEFRMTRFTRRERFRHRDIFLPLVLHEEGGEWLELDYQRHILAEIDWGDIRAPTADDALPDPAVRERVSVDLDEVVPLLTGEPVMMERTLEVAWFARRLSDVIPNPWQAARITRELLGTLRSLGRSDDWIHDRRSSLAFRVREKVALDVEELAERVFRQKLQKREIRFDLEAERPNLRLVEHYETPVSKRAGLLHRNDDRPIERSLFEPVFVDSFDSDFEREVARYLDEEKALRWWHRVAARQPHDYYLRGWRPDRIWPDFVAMGRTPDGDTRLFVFETKGEHLDNRETDYRRRVFESLEGAFDCGQLTIRRGPAKGTFRIVFRKEGLADALATPKPGAADGSAPDQRRNR